MTTVPIPVDDATAAAYQSAPERERERLARFAAEFFRASLLENGSRSESLQRIADALGEEARANG